MSTPSPPPRPLAIGDLVTRSGSKGTGEIVELLRAGQVRVAFGSLTVRCRASELTRVESVARQTRRAPTKVPLPSKKRARALLDLHGCDRQEAIRRLDDALNRAALDGCDHLEVVHGLGSDVLRRAVHNHLRGVSIVARFALKIGNPGATVVYLH